MVLVRQASVLKLAGSPSAQEQARLDVAGAVKSGNEIVKEYTRKKDWIEPDPDNDIEGDYGFYWAQEAAEKWAAARLADEWQNMNQKSERYRKEAMEALATLRKIGYGVVDGDNPSFYSTVTTYKTIGTAASANHVGAQSTRFRSRNALGGDYD
jgi:hypothetical protein